MSLLALAKYATVSPPLAALHNRQKFGRFWLLRSYFSFSQNQVLLIQSVLDLQFHVGGLYHSRDSEYVNDCPYPKTTTRQQVQKEKSPLTKVDVVQAKEPAQIGSCLWVLFALVEQLFCCFHGRIVAFRFEIASKKPPPYSSGFRFEL